MSPRYSPAVCCRTATTFIGVSVRPAIANASGLHSGITGSCQRVRDRGLEVFGGHAEHVDIVVIEERVDLAVDLLDARPGQVGLEIEHDSWRRHEKVA